MAKEKVIVTGARRKAVIVTGGAGFIGGHIVDLAVSKGLEVFSLDNYNTQKDSAAYRNQRARYIRCDIRDFKLLKKHFLKIKPKYVFHTAALARIQPSIKDPDTYLAVNSLGTLNVLKAAKLSGAKRVVYSASSSAYGLNPIPSKESMFPDPLNPYAKTKLDGEHWMKVFASVYGLETVSLRYFNVYGPRNSFTGAYTTVVTKFLYFYQNKMPMTIVGDGKQTRDYTHVYDVARANLLAATSKKVGKGEVLNIGCHKRYSVNQIAEFIVGKPLGVLLKTGAAEFIPPRLGEAEHTCADISRAKKLLNWSPKMNFRSGIAELKKLHKIS